MPWRPKSHGPLWKTAVAGSYSAKRYVKKSYVKKGYVKKSYVKKSYAIKTSQKDDATKTMTQGKFAMTMKSWHLLPLLVSTALLVSACSSAPGPSTASPSGPSSSSLSGAIVDQRWNLLLVGTDERISMPETPFFSIANSGKVSGYDGCNRFSGEVTLGENQRIEFSQLATTRMACPQMADAKRVTDMLETAYRYLIDHDRLVFFGPDSRVLGGWREGN